MMNINIQLPVEYFNILHCLSILDIFFNPPSYQYLWTDTDSWFFMRKTILLYSLAMAGLVLLMKLIDYRFLIRDISVEFYVGLVAVLFTALGIWVGLKFTWAKGIETSVPQGGSIETDPEVIAEIGLSKREMDVLELMAKGHSNQEIAEQLFISLNTVKTHTSNLFQKLSARRRTQAVQIAKAKGLIS